jgi:hypothetical protein
VLKDRLLRSEPSSASLHSQPKKAGAPAQAQSRSSHGLDQFFSSLHDQEGLSILDFSGASQANISFITSMGHRIYSNDVLRTMEEAFGSNGDFVANQSDPERAATFLRESLDFPERTFDGALIWDTLQFLAQPLLQDTVDRLCRILRPQASLLAFFHAEEKAQTAPLYTYRIVESKIMSLTPRNQVRAVQYFNNRNLEKLFQKYHSVKFFLTRDHLREVLVRRYGTLPHGRGSGLGQRVRHAQCQLHRILPETGRGIVDIGIDETSGSVQPLVNRHGEQRVESPRRGVGIIPRRH